MNFYVGNFASYQYWESINVHAHVRNLKIHDSKSCVWTFTRVLKPIQFQSFFLWIRFT